MHRILFYLVCASMAVLAVACDARGEMTDSEGRNMRIAALHNQTLPDGYENVNAFLFSDGKEYQRTEFTFKEGADVKIEGNPSMYFYSGPSLEFPEGDLTEQQLKNVSIAVEEGAQSAPDFYVARRALTPIQAVGKQVDVQMKHGVARMDLTTLSDSDISIEEIRVENAPAETYPLREGGKVSDRTVTFTKRYDIAFSGVATPVFNLFESAQPVKVHINGSYGNHPFDLNLTIPSLQRNEVYTVKVRKSGNKPAATFTVKEWT